MNKRLISLMAVALALLSASGQVKFTGVGEDYHVIAMAPENGVHLDSIYVLYSTQGVGMTYTVKSNVYASWKSFDSRGVSSSLRRIPVMYQGNVSTLSEVEPDKGYIIKEGNDSICFWVIDYSKYFLRMNGISFENEQSCDMLELRFDGTGPKIPYSDTYGRSLVLDRDLELSYKNLVWNENNTDWSEQPVVENNITSLDEVINIPAPLCDTKFRLSGDRFLKEWNIKDTVVESSVYHSQAVDCRTTVEYHKGDSVYYSIPSDLLSAPVHIVFRGYPSDAVFYSAWELANDPEFEDIYDRYLQDELDYTFNQPGTYYVRYKVVKTDEIDACEAYGETYTVRVTESYMPLPSMCPNFFTPGTSEGVNDIWRLPCKSMAEFHCWIFNRWGNLVYEYTDPDGGWDGRYHGKLVDPGVYFFVATGTGTDGNTWSTRGDINILGPKSGTSGTYGEGGY